jgi:hypothetical protein
MVTTMMALPMIGGCGISLKKHSLSGTGHGARTY